MIQIKVVFSGKGEKFLTREDV